MQTLRLSQTASRRVLWFLSFFHMSIIALSNVLVQIPLQIGPLLSTWGTFSFPFIFLATDLTVRLCGASLARRIIFCVMLPGLLLSYVASIVFHDGVWQGWQALSVFHNDVFRIALASFLAYLLGQLMDILVFQRLRMLPQWYIAPAASSIFGNALDTFVFFFIAFHASGNAFMAAHWQEIAWLDYGVKIAVNLLLFLPAYGVLLHQISQHLQKYATPPVRPQALL